MVIVGNNLRRFLRTRAAILSSLAILLFGGTALASPFGAGKFGANVPFGGETSLSIATNGNVTIAVTPTDSGASATSTSNVTVTSTDVVGYKLYVRALSNASLDNGGSTIPASGNSSPATLATNTWGYNTDASSNFVGMTLTDALIRTGTGPYSTGDLTTVTYGIKIDNSKPAGNYSTSIVYTAVPQTE